MYLICRWYYWFIAINWTPEAVTAAATAVLALLTLTLAGGTFGLWFATRRLVKSGENTAKTQLRAYISVQQFRGNRIVDTQSQTIIGWELSLIWQNTGNTPTRDMLTHISIRMEDNDLPDGFRFPDMWIIGRKQIYVPVHLAPNGVFIQTIGNFSVEQLQAVRDGKMILHIYGWADYNDVFHDTLRHRTEFCARIMLPGDPNSPTGDNVAFELHWKHNGADDECMRKPKTYVERERIPDLPLGGST